MSKINRPPLGLQQLLGSQNFGENPSDLKQDVQPVLEMFPLYGSGLLRVAEGTGSRTTEGLIVNTEFFGHSAIVSCSLRSVNDFTNAEAIAMSFALTNITGFDPAERINIASFNQSPRETGWPATSRPCWSFVFPTPLVVEPGVKLGAYYDFAVFAAAQSMELRVLYYDLSVP